VTNTTRPRKSARKSSASSATAQPSDAKKRVLVAWLESITNLIDAPPRASALIPLQERSAALGYQLGYFPLPPDPDLEWRLGRAGLLLRPSERLPEDAEIDREFENGGN